MRRLKSINVFFDASQTRIEDIHRIPNLKDIVYEELYNALKHTSETDDKIQLFEINNSGYVLELPKSFWVQALEKAIIFHEKKEEFEKCIDIKNLITKINEQGNSINTTSYRPTSKRKNKPTAKKAKS